MPAAILGLGVISLILWVGTDVLRTRLTTQDTALLRTAAEIQLNAAMAHLWLEEYVTGDSANLAEVWSRFERADGLTRDMLQGGRPGSPAPNLQPLDNPRLRRQTERLRRRLGELWRSARQRQEGLLRGENVGVGSASDQAFDHLFFQLSDDGRLLEQAIEVERERDEARSRMLLGALLLAWIAIIGAAAAGIWSRERRRRAAEEALRRSEAQLLQAQKMDAVGRLAGGLAHDVNNYVNAITSQCELVLMKAPPGDRVAAKMELVILTAGKITALIRRLLAFSKRQPVAPRVVDLNEIVAGLRGMMNRLIGEDLQLKTRLAADLWRTRVDPAQVEQIVVNLLINAREASPRGGQVTIETANVQPGPEDPRGAVLLALSDHGSGIAPELRDRIFEPFFTTKEGTEARGLGLATVYGIVQQNGGRVTVDSAVGSGTTFLVYLPRTLEAAPPRKTEPDTPRPAGAGETVLLVEDNDELRRATRELLEALGYRVVTAPNGPGAIAALEAAAGEIELAICDMVMPGMSGPEVVERLRALSPEIRVILMSGYTDNAMVRQGIAEGKYDGFQEKPFSAQGLAEKIRGVLTEPGERPPRP
jgi:signal transduction histidine kinase